MGANETVREADVRFRKEASARADARKPRVVETLVIPPEERRQVVAEREARQRDAMRKQGKGYYRVYRFAAARDGRFEYTDKAGMIAAIDAFLSDTSEVPSGREYLVVAYFDGLGHQSTSIDLTIDRISGGWPA